MESLTSRLARSPARPWPDRPVPVALTITELDPGGAEKALVHLALGLDRRRWAPSVVALGPEAAFAGVLRAAAIPTVCLGLGPRRVGEVVPRLARALRTIRPALVQSFLFHANVATRLAAPLAGRPWVVGGLRVAERDRGWHLALDRATIGLACGLVCVSRGVRDFSIARGGLPGDRLVVIPNGIDTAAVDAAPALDPSAIVPPGTPVGERPHLALFVGRLDRQKGVAALLDAATRVVAERPDWHLLIAGDGPLAGPLRERARELPHLVGRLTWLGRRDDVPSLLKAVDLLVLPSLWEGMPNVVLEAMAAGLPVVGTAVEGTVDLVEPGRTGWIVPPGDPAALADALLDAAADPDRRRRFGRAGRARVEAEFAQARVVAAYGPLWAGVLGFDPAALE